MSPSNSKYSNLSNEELILFLANDLISELEKNADDYFSFGEDEKMKNSEIVKEIKSLSPLGKEVIGNWFAGVKRHLDFLHKERLND